MDKSAAGWANAAKVAPIVRQGNVFCHVAGGLFSPAARQAVDFSRPQALPSRSPTRLQKGGERSTFEEDGTLAVDRLEALPLPVADRVAVATEESRRFLDSVGSMRLDPIWIWNALAHRAPHERSEVDFWGSADTGLRPTVQIRGRIDGIRPAFRKTGPPPTTASLASHRGEQGNP
jgi:hypothetical protein